MNPSSKDWIRDASLGGVYGGLALILAALVGMVEQFSKRAIIDVSELAGQALMLHHVLLFGGFFAIGYVAARKRRDDLAAGLAAALAGAAAGLMLGLLVLLGNRIDLTDVLLKATPKLFELLQMGAGPAGAVVMLVLAGAVMGLLGGGLARLPEALRGASIWGLSLVALLGTLQSIITRQVGLVTSSRKTGGIIAKMVDGIYASKGLSVFGALVVFGLIVLAIVGWPRLRERVGASVDLSPTSRNVVTWAQRALLLLVLLWLPLGLGTYPSQVIDTMGIFILMGLGLNIVVGFAGLLDLGYVAFYAIGAYTVAFLTSPNTGVELSFWTALPLAVLASIVAGILLGIPVLKTHGDYLAIITLGFGEIIRILAFSDALKESPGPDPQPWLGGARGIQGIPKAIEIPKRDFGPLGTFDPQIQQEMYYLILVACALVLYISWRLLHSRYGRAWMAVREDEHVAEAMGINLVNTKLFAFATGAAMAGLGGAIFASMTGTIFPASFGLLISINVLVLIIVGGMGSIPGVFVGGLALVGLPELLREFNDFRMLLYGVVLVVMMLNRPEGLWPTAIAKRELHRGGGEA